MCILTISMSLAVAVGDAAPLTSWLKLLSSVGVLYSSHLHWTLKTCTEELIYSSVHACDAVKNTSDPELQ